MVLNSISNRVCLYIYYMFSLRQWRLLFTLFISVTPTQRISANKYR